MTATTTTSPSTSGEARPSGMLRPVERRRGRRGIVVAAAATAALLVPHAQAAALAAGPAAAFVRLSPQHLAPCPLTARAAGAFGGPTSHPLSNTHTRQRARGRGQLNARLSFQVTSKRLFNKVKKEMGRTSRTILGGERGRFGSNEIPHDEVTYRCVRSGVIDGPDHDGSVAISLIDADGPIHTNPNPPITWSHIRRRGPDSAELTSIPQPERYSSQDWVHNIKNLPGSQVRLWNGSGCS